MNAAQFNEYIRQLKARNESELTVKRAEVSDSMQKLAKSQRHCTTRKLTIGAVQMASGNELLVGALQMASIVPSHSISPVDSDAVDADSVISTLAELEAEVDKIASTHVTCQNTDDLLRHVTGRLECSSRERTDRRLLSELNDQINGEMNQIDIDKQNPETIKAFQELRKLQKQSRKMIKIKSESLQNECDMAEMINAKKLSSSTREQLASINEKLVERIEAMKQFIAVSDRVRGAMRARNGDDESKNHVINVFLDRN